MYKRKREDSLSEDCMMEVQISKDHYADTDETIPPRLVNLLKEIVRSGPGNGDVNFLAELVERNLSPLGVSPLGNHVKTVTGCELAELDKFTSEADSRLKQTFMAKICTISEQMRFVRQQLVNVLEEAEESLGLNHVPCNFHKVPGSVYYLYQRPSGQKYFSILSPLDWDEKPPHQYCGAYLYDHDFSWKKH